MSLLKIKNYNKNMELRVGYLKKVLEKLDENIILADLPHGTKYFKPFNFVKRLLVLKDVSPNKEWGGETYLSINSMGSDYTGNGEQEGLQYTGVHFDEQTFSSVVDKDPKQETNKVEEYFNMYMDFEEYENTIYYKYDKEKTVKDVVIKAMQEYYNSRQSEVDDLAIKLELSECRAESFKNEIDKLKSEIEGVKINNHKMLLDFYKELKGFGRLYSDNTSEELMMNDVSEFLKLN